LLGITYLVEHVMSSLASFPGLHAQLLSLAVRKIAYCKHIATTTATTTAPWFYWVVQSSQNLQTQHPPQRYYKEILSEQNRELLMGQFYTSKTLMYYSGTSLKGPPS